MDTPVDELKAAATLLRQRATDATPGPWHRPLNTRYKSSVTAPLPEGESGTRTSGTDPTTGERERVTVATVPIWSNGRHFRARSGRDLKYIALLDPDVGTALAEMLDAWAHIGNLDPDLLNGAGGLETLAVARQILGTDR